MFAWRRLAPDICPKECRLAKVGEMKIRTGEVYVGKVNTAKVCAAEIGHRCLSFLPPPIPGIDP
jgi:hypothetical protein